MLSSVRFFVSLLSLASKKFVELESAYRLRIESVDLSKSKVSIEYIYALIEKMKWVCVCVRCYLRQIKSQSAAACDVYSSHKRFS